MIATQQSEADLLPGERRADPPERCGGCGYPSQVFRGRFCRHCAAVRDTAALAESRSAAIRVMWHRCRRESGRPAGQRDWSQPGAHDMALADVRAHLDGMPWAERDQWCRTALEASLMGLDYRPHAAERPCHDPPGSREKLAALEARAAAGEDLWHPEDEDPRQERLAGTE